MTEPDVVCVLIVEDDEPFATVIARYLRARHYEVRQVPSGEDARVALSSGYRPSLVLLDINLPGESGWSLLRGPEYAAAGSPPVVVMTATHVHSSWLRAFGVVGYLPKPFAMETLLATIERITNSPQRVSEAMTTAGEIDVG
jgi:DNA-binding response OmpR family regulator